MPDHGFVEPAQRASFRADVLAGLAGAHKTLPSRWLYDAHGSELFERITQLPEYYPTRVETAILADHAADIADFIGPQAVLIEYGAGAGIKTEIVIAALRAPRLYAPIDIAGDFLAQTMLRLRHRFPHLDMLPVVADFTADFALPPQLPLNRRTAFFPGSTIGNLDRAETIFFLNRLRHHVGPGGAAIIGIDLKKDLNLLLPAYDDRQGVTAAFNLNLLTRINRELAGDFHVADFIHQARWNARESAVEMHLVSQIAQTVPVGDRCFNFAPGETIHTESSRKYDVAEFTCFAARNHWRVARTWVDENQLFAVVGMRAD